MKKLITLVISIVVILILVIAYYALDLGKMNSMTGAVRTADGKITNSSLELYINTMYSSSFDLISTDKTLLKTVQTTSRSPTYIVSLEGSDLVITLKGEKIYSMNVQATSLSYIDIKLVMPGVVDNYIIQHIQGGEATDILEIKVKQS